MLYSNYLANSKLLFYVTVNLEALGNNDAELPVITYSQWTISNVMQHLHSTSGISTQRCSIDNQLLLYTYKCLNYYPNLKMAIYYPKLNQITNSSIKLLKKEQTYDCQTFG